MAFNTIPGLPVSVADPGTPGTPQPSVVPPNPNTVGISPTVVGPIAGPSVPPGYMPPGQGFGNTQTHPGSPTDLGASLSGPQRDAYEALQSLFASYGLGDLAPTILQYVQNGYGSDTITILLQQTPEYKARFKGNDTRIANGLAVLTPAEYLSTEASYRQILVANGIDPLWANTEEYAKWIGNDMSPNELQSRVNLAVQATTQAPPSLVQYFNELGISTGSLASYFLNGQVPTPALQLRMNQAQIGASALQNNLDISAQDALKYAEQGVTYGQAQSAYQRIGDILPTALQLTSIYKNQAPVNQQTLEQEFLGQSGQAQLSVERLGQQETAAFGGQSGVQKNSFQQQVGASTTF